MKNNGITFQAGKSKSSRIDLIFSKHKCRNINYVGHSKPGAGAPGIVTTKIGQRPHTTGIPRPARDRARADLQSREGPSLPVRPAVSGLRGSVPGGSMAIPEQPLATASDFPTGINAGQRCSKPAMTDGSAG